MMKPSTTKKTKVMATLFNDINPKIKLKKKPAMPATI